MFLKILKTIVRNQTPPPPPRFHLMQYRTRCMSIGAQVMYW
jgi:hypothetical protein